MVSMASNGFEIGAAAFGVVSGLVLALALALALAALALALALVVFVLAELLALVAAQAGSLRLESICGRSRDGRDGRDGRNEDRRADGELIPNWPRLSAAEGWARLSG